MKMVITEHVGVFADVVKGVEAVEAVEVVAVVVTQSSCAVR